MLFPRGNIFKMFGNTTHQYLVLDSRGCPTITRDIVSVITMTMCGHICHLVPESYFTAKHLNMVETVVGNLITCQNINEVIN